MASPRDRADLCWPPGRVVATQARMSDDAPLDFTSLGMDLAASFQPSWAKTAEGPSRYADHPGEDPSARPRRDFSKGGPRGGGGRGDRAGGRRPEGRRRDDGRKGSPQQRGDHRKGGSKGAHKGGRGGDDRRDREAGPDRREREALAGWEVAFLPDPRGMEGLARQIRTLARAYPLFELARLVLAAPERYSVAFKPVAAPATPLYLYRPDQTLWTSESAAVRHAVGTSLDRYYSRETVEAGAPKGNFAFVAECDGVLLGPPNHHEYQSRLSKLHSEKFSRMPFEAFKARVRMLRDEESINRWKESVSRREVFHPLDLSAPQDPAPPAEPATEPATETPAELAAGPAVEPSAAEPAAEMANEPTESASPAETGPSGSAEVTAPARPPALKDLDAVIEHFRAHHAASTIERVEGEVTVPGVAVARFSSQPVRNSVRDALEKLVRFPLALSNLISQELSHRGLQFFKAHQNITYVGIARPRPVPRDQLGPALRAMVDILSAGGRTPRAELWKTLLESRPVPDGGDEAAREVAVRADLAWLLHEGLVTDFANRGFEVVPARPPKTPDAAAD